MRETKVRRKERGAAVERKEGGTEGEDIEGDKGEEEEGGDGTESVYLPGRQRRLIGSLRMMATQSDKRNLD